MFNTNQALAFRNNGLSNKQIAARMGVHYITVLNNIGKQPKFMTIENQRLGKHQASENRMIIKSHAKTMQAIANIDNKIVVLTQKRNELLKTAK